jgi:hypothetical protein
MRSTTLKPRGRRPCRFALRQTSLVCGGIVAKTIAEHEIVAPSRSGGQQNRPANFNASIRVFLR